MRQFRRAPLFLLLALAACSSSAPTEPVFTFTPVTPPTSAAGPEIIPVVVSSEIVPGRNRFLFSMTDAERNLIASPDLDVQLELFSRDGTQGTKLADYETEFIWAIEGERGLYVAYPEFPSAGRYGFRFLANRPGEPVMTVLADFDVAPEATTPLVGDPAIPSDTPTADDVDGDLARISTDDEPEPEMYELSVADAIEAGEPFVVTFATPEFCTSRVAVRRSRRSSR